MKNLLLLASLLIIPLSGLTDPMSREDYFRERFPPKVVAVWKQTSPGFQKAIMELGLELNPNGNYNLRRKGFTEQQAYDLVVDLSKYSQVTGELFLYQRASECIRKNFTLVDWMELLSLIHAGASGVKYNRNKATLTRMAQKYRQLHRKTTLKDAEAKVCDLFFKDCTLFNESLQKPCYSTSSKLMQEHLEKEETELKYELKENETGEELD